MDKYEFIIKTCEQLRKSVMPKDKKLMRQILEMTKDGLDKDSSAELKKLKEDVAKLSFKLDSAISSY
jgi:hypothetical protein